MLENPWSCLYLYILGEREKFPLPSPKALSQVVLGSEDLTRRPLGKDLTKLPCQEPEISCVDVLLSRIAFPENSVLFPFGI